MHDENDAQKILREVEKRKQRAKDLGIEKVLLCLFFGDGYGSFSAYKIEGASLISDFKKSGDFDNRWCRFILNIKNYFVSCHKSTLQISIDEKKVLTVKMGDSFTPVNDPYISGIEKWWCSEIESFIEGEWVQELKNLIIQIEINEKEEKRKKEENPERIKQLKDDFGIE